VFSFVLQAIGMKHTVKHYVWNILVVTIRHGLLTVMNGQTSLNRLNLGASMTRLGRTHVVTSSFSYNFILQLPSHNTSQVAPLLPGCVGWIEVYNNGTMDVWCASGIKLIREALQSYRGDTYREIHEKIEQIYNMLPPELDIQPAEGRRLKKGLFNFAGEILSYITGVATQSELTGLYDRIIQLEIFLTDNMNTNHLQIGQLITAEKLVSKRIDDIVSKVKKHAIWWLRPLRS